MVDLGEAVWASWAPDGTRIAWGQVDLDQDEAYLGARLLTSLPDGSDLVAVADSSQYSWAPSSDQLLVTEWDPATQTEFAVLVNSDGTGRRVLSEGQPQGWSPDGSRILYSTFNADPILGRSSVLWIHELATGIDQEVGTWGEGSWSPDGTRLVGTGDPRLPHFAAGEGLWIYDVSTGNSTELIHEGGKPDWAPFGSVIVYWAQPTPDTAPVPRTIDVVTGQVTEIVYPLSFGIPTGGSAFWSPTGEHLVVVWEDGLENDTVALHRLDGSVIWDSGSLGWTFSGGPTLIQWAPDGSGFLWPPQDLTNTWQLVTTEGSTRNLPIAGWVADWQPLYPQDIDSSVFRGDIGWLWSEQVTKGCNPPWNDRFCPNEGVTRGQMAAFLVRVLGLTERSDDPFWDDDSSIFEADIERLAALGITKGCNPPVNDRFCPNDDLTRGQMAAFLVRALGYTDAGDGNLFVDDDDSIFEADIDRLGNAGLQEDATLLLMIGSARTAQ